MYEGRDRLAWRGQLETVFGNDARAYLGHSRTSLKTPFKVHRRKIKGGKGVSYTLVCWNGKRLKFRFILGQGFSLEKPERYTTLRKVLKAHEAIMFQRGWNVLDFNSNPTKLELKFAKSKIKS